MTPCGESFTTIGCKLGDMLRSELTCASLSSELLLLVESLLFLLVSSLVFLLVGSLDRDCGTLVGKETLWAERLSANECRFSSIRVLFGVGSDSELSKGTLRFVCLPEEVMTGVSDIVFSELAFETILLKGVSTSFLVVFVFLEGWFGVLSTIGESFVFFKNLVILGVEEDLGVGHIKGSVLIVLRMDFSFASRSISKGARNTNSLA